MSYLFSSRLTILTSLVVAMAGLSACSTIRPAPPPHAEEFLSSAVFSQSFPGSERQICEAARRALLSQGYVIGSERPEGVVKGRKYFQPESELHVQIEFHVTCAPNSTGSNSATAFVNAVRDRYSLRKSANSASLGVGALGSISLPFGSSDDSLVKVASETIPDKRFYTQFFDLVERYLDPGATATAVSPDAE